MRTSPRSPHRQATLVVLAVAGIVAACGAVSVSPALPRAPGSLPPAAPSSANGTSAGGAEPAASAQGTGLGPPLTPAREAQLSTTLLRLRAADHLPGVQAVVRTAGGATWSGHAGFADLATHERVTATTLFDAGSITKTFVAALTLQLAGEGVLALDDPLSRWLPGFTRGPGVTLRELLDQTSGIDDPFLHASLLDALGAHPRRSWTPDQVLRYTGRPHFAPGRGWFYSNANYILLGQVIHRATGASVAELIRRRFLDPLGLGHTFLQGQEPVFGIAAHGYAAAVPASGAPTDLSDGTSYLPFTSLATALGTAGALVTTADDLSRWAEALYGGRVLEPAALGQMLDFGLTRGLKPRWPYGLGAQQIAFSGRVSWGHSGLLSGYHAAMRYFPGSGLTITVLTNSDAANPDTIVAALLGVLYPAPAAAASGPPLPTVTPLPPSTASPVAPSAPTR
jgi:D-alanyl-D-alanine carboxypeptidase